MAETTGGRRPAPLVAGLLDACENAINKSNKGKSLVTLIFLSQSEVKKP